MKLDKEKAVKLCIISFLLAVVCIVATTLGIHYLEGKAADSLTTGINLMIIAGDGNADANDILSSIATIGELKDLSFKYNVCKWIRLIGGIAFSALGIYFVFVAIACSDEKQGS